MSVQATFRRRHRVVKRLSVTRSETQGNADLPPEGGIDIGDGQLHYRWKGWHFRGVRAGTRPRVAVAVSGDGQSLKRTVRLKAT